MGHFACTKETLEQIRKYELPIGYTMDLGNWYWQKEDPEKSFKELKDQITIFHLKNIAFENEKPWNCYVRRRFDPMEEDDRSIGGQSQSIDRISNG